MAKHEIKWLNLRIWWAPTTAKITDSLAKEVFDSIRAAGYQGTKLLLLETIQSLSHRKGKDWEPDPGFSYISQVELAKKLNIDRRQAQRHLADLVDDGALACGERLGEEKQNLYAVDHAVLEESNADVIGEKLAKRKKRKLEEKANRTQDTGSLAGQAAKVLTFFKPRKDHLCFPNDGDSTATMTVTEPSGAAVLETDNDGDSTATMTVIAPHNDSNDMLMTEGGQSYVASATAPKHTEVGLGSTESKSYGEATKFGESDGEANLLVMPSPIEFSTALEAKFQSWRSRESSAIATREAFQSLHEQWTANPYGLAEFEAATYRIIRILRVGAE